MKNISKKSKKLSFFTIEQPSGETTTVSNVAQIAHALGAVYCGVWKRMKPLLEKKTQFVIIKHCIIRQMDVEVTKFYSKDSIEGQEDD